jgi:acetylornithine deacetylase/succinyl-diaminopimelate desuccinylase-like protein
MPEALLAPRKRETMPQRHRRAVLACSIVVVVLFALAGTLPAGAVAPERLIIFQSDRGGHVDLWTTRSDGSELAPLTNDKVEDVFPEWSPDGKKIAWTSGGLGPAGEIWVMNADGTGRRQITHNAFSDFDVAWSPDSSQLTYRSARGGLPDIFVINTDGTSERQLTTDPARDIAPDWSPDGSRIVFTSDLSGGSQGLWSIRVSDGRAVGEPELVKADFAVNADGGQYDENTPEILMSLRGTAVMEFSIKTADIDGHSGQFGGKTPNSAVIMSQIISSFYTKEGNIAVEGFYDKVVPATVREKEMMNKIPYNKADDMKILGTTVEVGDTTYSSLERIWFRPTLEIIGMQSGYTALEGHSNIIPGSAMARITCRLVNNQNPSDIQELLINHINKNLPAGATVTYKFGRGKGGASPMKFPADTKEYKYLADVLKNIYGKPPVQMGTGGSIGSLISIKETLGIYCYSLGMELPDEKWHASNEFFRLSSIRKGQLIYCYYLQHLADEESKLIKK